MSSIRPPSTRIRYFDNSDTAATAAKIHPPRTLHQSPWGVPGTRSTNATPFPVSNALDGQVITLWRDTSIAESMTAQVVSAIKIWAIEMSKCKTVWPRTCSETTTNAT